MSYDELSEQVVATARRMLDEGLVKGTWGNVSTRIPGSLNMLITPSGMDYQTMIPNDLVMVNGQGNSIQGRWKPSTEGPLHLAIYHSRPDVGAIVHTHSMFATAFAAARRPIPAITEEIAQVIGGSVEIAPYAVCGSSDLATVAVRSLGQKMAVLMANHGLVGVGRDLKEALLACIIAEKTAKIAAMAQLLGGYTEFGPNEIRELRDNFLNKYGQ